MNRGITFLSLAGLVLMGVAIGGWFWLQNHVEQRLVSELKSSLKAEVLLDELWLNLWAGRLEVRNVKLQSLSDSSPWKRAHLEKISGTFALQDLFAASTPLQVEVDRGTILLQGPVQTQEPDIASTPSVTVPGIKSGWPRLELRQIRVRDLTLQAPEIPLSFTGIQGQVEKLDEASWRGNLSASSLSLFSYQFGESTFQFVSNRDSLEVSSYTLQAEKGSIIGKAHFPHSEPEKGLIHFDLKQVPVSMLLPSQWQVILQGLATGSGDYKGSLFDWKKSETQAKLTLEEAKLQSLPLLEKLALIPGLADKAGVKLDQARTDLSIKEGQVLLTNLAVTRQQMLSWQGQITVHPDSRIEGSTMLGIPSSVAALIPPLKEKIFTTEQDGYAWTPVKLSGTTEKLEEDLSPRLVALAQESGSKTLEQGKTLLDEGLKKAGEWLEGVLK